MDPSGSKRKGGLIPVMSLKKQKGQDGKTCLFCGGKGDLRCPSEEKSYYGSGERKADTERPGDKFHHPKNTSRKWTRNPAI